MHKIKSIHALKDSLLSAVFFDGTIKQYDVKTLYMDYPQFKILESDTRLFKQVHVDVGGYGVSWDDELDLSAEIIWNNGQTTDVTHVDISLQLADCLVNARETCGLTQKQLAEKTGIYQADISKIERGLANPSLSTLKKLADGLGMALDIRFI